MHERWHELIALLELFVDDDTGQGWSDFGFDRCLALLAAFTADDWAQLQARLTGQHTEHLVELLSVLPSQGSASRLCSILPKARRVAFVECAAALGRLFRSDTKAAMQHLPELRVAGILDGFQRELEAFINFPRPAGEAFDDFLRRYAHLVSEDALYLYSQLSS